MPIRVEWLLRSVRNVAFAADTLSRRSASTLTWLKRCSGDLNNRGFASPAPAVKKLPPGQLSGSHGPVDAIRPVLPTQAL